MSGECESNGKFTLEDLLKGHALEERIYRLRCVEAWSMVIPWVGLPLADLLKRFKPTSKAKYVAFKTVHAPGRDAGAALPRARLAVRRRAAHRRSDAPARDPRVGLYGKTLPNQNGAPLRLITPWKYGFKGIKSIVKIRFTERQPPTTWNISAPHEYGFYANVNPKVDHPRWSQARERRIGGELFESRVDDADVQRLRAGSRRAVQGHGPEEILLIGLKPDLQPIAARSMPSTFVVAGCSSRRVPAVPAAARVAGLGAFEIGGTSLGANPVEKIQDTLGQWGLRFLLLTLASRRCGTGSTRRG